ncbi:TetR/AcrR family transcriptional regulator [Actinosynnema pretiosum subsp. pretiosum]|uniref:Transcriptional regulator, TetR family n=2 Tax=Actinosynnema TaxID=40566 RepID=C6WIE1_ACTMD|nr:TetR/AcrR family transcriptional regulator [Actinosynnema mirum]ACU36184.1 transcriptional regulator, TetR family [Actinosynnema mirum DSM 43827]QUF06132.1 TetR/AcrR family transcriptional regulator [Actinosynnema pretiosum subsp. pretiosum]
MAKRPTYHHGDLRSALVDAGLALVAEGGVASLSVAEAARRTGVSPAAPYRHFPARDDLLTAVATKLANLLAEELRQATTPLPTPEARLAAAAGACALVTARYRVGIDLIFAEDLRSRADQDLAEAGRAVIDLLLPDALTTTGTPEAALSLLEKLVATAHGHGVLLLTGFARRFVPDEAALVASATESAAILIRAAHT